MKKIIRVIAVILLAAMGIQFVSCRIDDNTKTGETTVTSDTAVDSEDVVGIAWKTEQSDDALTVDNGTLRLMFDKANGSITAIDNLVTGTSNLSGEGSGAFTLYIDTSTSDLWKSTDDFSKLVRVSSRGQSVSDINVRVNKDNTTISFKYNIVFESDTKKFEGITVTQSVRLDNLSGDAGFTYEIKNDCDNVTVVSLVAAQLGGIKAENNYTLFWPLREGELHENAVSQALSSRLCTGEDIDFNIKNSKYLQKNYPSNLSMQLMQLFNDSEGIYYFIEDNTAEYKLLNFGLFGENNDMYDSDLTGNNVSMSVVFYPFVEPGKTKLTAKTVIGIQSEGGWYRGSDIYREWLLTKNTRSENYTAAVTEMYGFVAAIAKGVGKESDVTLTYAKNKYYGVVSLDDYIESFDKHNTDTIAVLGWSDDGFDTKYPDFNFNPQVGTAEELTEAVSKAHKAGDRVLMYLNAWVACNDSVWYGKYGADAVVKRSDGSANMWQSTFGCICPYSDEWVKTLCASVEKLAACGVDGFLFDQVMEMPSTLCFDRSHGHANPATAYGEGMKKLFTGIRAVMDKYSDDYVFLCEGICDAYIEYIDLPSINWARPYKSSSYVHYELARYTIPTKRIGMWNDVTPGAEDEHALAFMMGNPILIQAGIVNEKVIKETGAYKKYADIYNNGRFMADRGISGLAPGLVAGIFTGTDSFILTVYNPYGNEIKTDIRFDLSSLGFSDKTIASVSGVFGRINITKTDTGVTVNVPGNNYISIIIKLK